MASIDPVSNALSVLEESFGLAAPKSLSTLLGEYCALVSTWNNYASLISAKDLKDGLTGHLADSLSLVPLVERHLMEGRAYIDIGSGNGLPGIPLLLFLERVPGILVERNSRKVTFLQSVITKLGLDHVDIVEGSFPDVDLPESPLVITARAMEKPSQFLESLRLELSEESRFIRQVGTSAVMVPDGLVEVPYEDAFDETGLRRGRLFEVRRASA